MVMRTDATVGMTCEYVTITGHNGDQIARLPMLVDQREGCGSDRRPDDLSHELRMPGIKLRARKARECAKCELEVLDRIQRALLILFVKDRIARSERSRIHRTGANQKLSPFIIRIQRQQRIVEIEEREVHEVG